MYHPMVEKSRPRCVTATSYTPLLRSKKIQEFPLRLTRTSSDPRCMLRMFFKANRAAKARYMAKRMTIRITSEAFLFLRGSSTQISWCPACVRESEMLTLERACAFYGGESFSFVEWLELTDVHRSRAADGSWLICLRSLLDCLQNKNTP
jgi:hypothetical protein